MGKSTISMAVFNSYFDITRGYIDFTMLMMDDVGIICLQGRWAVETHDTTWLSFGFLGIHRIL